MTTRPHRPLNHEYAARLGIREHRDTTVRSDPGVPRRVSRTGHGTTLTAGGDLGLPTSTEDHSTNRPTGEDMAALAELEAMGKAFEALRGLNGTERVRALQWLSGALSGTDTALHIVDHGGPGAAENAPTVVVRESIASSAPTARKRPAKVVPPAPKSTRPAAAAKPPAQKSTSSGGDSPRSRRRQVSATAQNARPYRRMPPADEVLAAYRQVGTVTGLADFFGVPQHTVKDWSRRLRKEGYQIGQGSR
jgi:hypothetical protein